VYYQPALMKIEFFGKWGIIQKGLPEWESVSKFSFLTIMSVFNVVLHLWRLSISSLTHDSLKTKEGSLRKGEIL
jgi:hypothetical protein